MTVSKNTSQNHTKLEPSKQLPSAQRRHPIGRYSSDPKLNERQKKRKQLEEDGHIWFRAKELSINPSKESYNELVTLAQNLPADPHAKEPNRYRCLQYGIYISWGKKKMIFEPASVDPATGEKFVPYRQGSENPDPEAKDVVRRFAPMPDVMQKNTALQQLVRADFELTPFAKKPPSSYRVTIHVIRHTVMPGHSTVGSPDLVHTDGVLLSFVHVIERSNVIGGVNCITKREHAGKKWTEVPIEDVHALATIIDPFDGYAFIDGTVAHYVSAIKAEGSEQGARTILIIDFAPMQEAKTM